MAAYVAGSVLIHAKEKIELSLRNGREKIRQRFRHCASSGHQYRKHFLYFNRITFGAIKLRANKHGLANGSDMDLMFGRLFMVLIQLHIYFLIRCAAEWVAVSCSKHTTADRRTHTTIYQLPFSHANYF